jgi:hypothetical protein
MIFQAEVLQEYDSITRWMKKRFSLTDELVTQMQR